MAALERLACRRLPSGERRGRCSKGSVADGSTPTSGGTRNAHSSKHLGCSLRAAQFLRELPVLWMHHIVTWSLTCTYSQFGALRSPTCCLSISAFYSDRLIKCPKCSCGCQNNSSNEGICVEGNSPDLGPDGYVQSELLFRKDPSTFTLRTGWAFPRRVYFNGDKCVMPPPDEYPWLPNASSKLSVSVIPTLVLLLVLATSYF